MRDTLDSVRVGETQLFSESEFTVHSLAIDYNGITSARLDEYLATSILDILGNI